MRHISTKSDVWSLGCTVLEMVQGHAPYRGINSIAVMYKVAQSGAGPPLPVGVSDELTDFVSHCFRKRPSKRFSCTQLMALAWMSSTWEIIPTKGEIISQKSVMHKQISRERHGRTRAFLGRAADECSVC